METITVEELSSQNDLLARRIDELKKENEHLGTELNEANIEINFLGEKLKEAISERDSYLHDLKMEDDCLYRNDYIDSLSIKEITDILNRKVAILEKLVPRTEDCETD